MENLFAGMRAALFDLDGTLIDTHIDFDLMRRESLRLAAEYGANMEGLAGRDVLGIVEAVREWLGGDRGDAYRADAYAMLEQIEVSHCANPAPVEGAAELLRHLDEMGIAVGIVTRNCRAVSTGLVKWAGLAHGALLTRDDVPRTKPDPGHLLAALEALGCREGARVAAIMVGDHWMDVQGGRAAGMRTVGLLRGRPESFYTPARPDVMVDELAELLPLARTA